MMNKQLRLTGTAYSGRVGARMRPPRVKPAALCVAVPHRVVRVTGGPYDNKGIRLNTENGPPRSFVFTVRGQTGFYDGGRWQTL